MSKKTILRLAPLKSEIPCVLNGSDVKSIKVAPLDLHVNCKNHLKPETKVIFVSHCGNKKITLEKKLIEFYPNSLFATLIATGEKEIPTSLCKRGLEMIKEFYETGVWPNQYLSGNRVALCGIACRFVDLLKYLCFTDEEIDSQPHADTTDCEDISDYSSRSDDSNPGQCDESLEDYEFDDAHNCPYEEVGKPCLCS